MKKEIRNLLIVSLITFIVSCLCNFNSSNLLITVLMSIIETMSIVVYIILVNKPILALILAFIQQIVSIIYDLVIGIAIKDAVNSFIIYGGITLACIFIHFLIIDKKNDTTSIKSRVINVIKTDRKPSNVPIWSKLIIYSTLVTMVMYLSKSNDTLDTLGLQGVFRVYGTVVLVLPIILYGALLTTTTIAFEMLLIRVILEIITMYNLYSIGEFKITQLLYVCIEILVVIYTFRNIKVRENGKRK